jgi:hypothetical protein
MPSGIGGGWGTGFVERDLLPLGFFSEEGAGASDKGSVVESVMGRTELKRRNFMRIKLPGVLHSASLCRKRNYHRF